MIKNWNAAKNALNSCEYSEISVEFEPYDQVLLRPDYLLELFSGKKVIHLGHTGNIESIKSRLGKDRELHELLCFACEKYIGIDTNKEVPRYLHSRGIQNVIYADISKPGIPQITNEKYDYMLLENILERAVNPVQFLKDIASDYGGQVNEFVINVPNMFGLPDINSVISSGRETVSSECRYIFTPYTVMKTVCAAGLQINDVQMCLNENSKGMLLPNEKLFKARPILLDSVCVVCRKK